MTETLMGMSPSSTEELLNKPSLAQVAARGPAHDCVVPAEPSAEELAIARELVRSARARGVAITGPGGMLKALTKTMIETALDEEMAEHVGHEKNQAPESR